MSVLSIPNSFAPGQLVQSALVDANFTAIATWANGNIDNTNIGAAGIYASQIIPTSTPQATFGGNTGYIFGGFGTGVIPLTINAPSGQTVDIFDVSLNNVKAFSVNSTGVAVFASSPIFGGGLTLSTELDFTGTTVTSTAVAIGGDAGGTAGMIFNVPSGSTNGFQFQVAGSTVFSISNNGTVGGAGIFTGAGTFGGALKCAPTINSVTVSSWVTPLYTDATGTTAAATAHEEFGTVTVAGSSSTTVTLSNNAVFASSGSYIVNVTQNDGSTSNVGVPVVTYTSGSSFTINNTGSGSHTFAWYAVGT